MRVLVTGGCGFLGSHLTERLVADGHRVTAIDDLSTGRIRNLTAARRTRGLTVHTFDITEPDLRDLLVREAPEVVCHLASRDSGDPVLDAAVNVGGTTNLLQACLAGGVERVIQASDAAAVYAPTSARITERAGVAPSTPYGASRAAAETYVQSYPLPSVVLRLAEVYGPRSRTGVVAELMRAAAAGKPGIVRGPAGHDLLHVDDAVDAFLRCLGGKADGRRLNIGSGTGTAARALHTWVSALAGTPDAPDFAPAPEGPAPVLLDCGGARRALGWEPAVGLEAGLTRTWESWKTP
ncbi:MAG: NAD-dependent epimerase/dehydratase [Frankiales bacterium]|nr:NAD-dependent epimerase/dehydratase [Frankiales bacterium]